MIISGISSAVPPVQGIANVARTTQVLNTAAYVEKESFSTTGTSFILQHVYADITGDATHTISGKIRFTFDDATTVDGAVGSATTTKNIVHYDNAASTSTADAWAAAETSVNLQTVLGTTPSGKRLTKVSLFLKENSATANAVYAWSFRVAGVSL